MPKRGTGAAMLRDLREDERPQTSEEAEEGRTDASESVLTEVRTYGDTYALTDASTEAHQEGSTDAPKSARKPARKDVQTQAREPVRKEALKSAGTDAFEAEGFMEIVEAALADREPLIGGVKATVDMSPELSTRAKRYLADHRGQNTRQVLIALFDTFLSAKGY